jgi:DNA-binding response OmpR family regulator
MSNKNGELKRELKILFVEDTEEDAFPIRYSILEHFPNCKIETVSSKKAAMEKVDELEEKGETFDFYIIDIMLDEGIYAGADFANELKERFNGSDDTMPAVIVTAMFPDADILEYKGKSIPNPKEKKDKIYDMLRKANVERIIAKPVDTDELIKIIELLLKNRAG